MRLPRSLQWRLSLGLGLGITLLWIATMLVTVQNLRHEMDEVFDSALAETAQRILPLAVMDIIDRQEEGLTQSVATLNAHDEFFTYVVRDASGIILLRSHDADDTIFPAFTMLGFTDTPTHRVYYDAALQGTITIAVAEPLAHRRAVAFETFKGLAMPLILLIPLSLWGVWWLVKGSMAPLRSFRDGIEKRGSTDLAPISATKLPSEIEPIAEAVNQLLNRLRRTLEAERSFTANAAHELRTPVAAALAQTQRLIADSADTVVQDKAHQIEDALQRLTRLSEKLMQLARAEGGRITAKDVTDIAPVLKLVVHDLATDRDGRDRIDSQIPETSVMSNIDPDAFAILARNLIENAVKHGADDSPVEVVLTQDAVLQVRNDGPAVPQGILDRLTRPFVRGNSLAQGNGLGLAIVKTIASSIGGDLTLTSPLPGQSGGFEAKFTPPRRV